MTTPDPPAELDRRIATSRRARFGDGVPEPCIAEAERHLGRPFPPSYRAWLGRYGYGYLAGVPLQGLLPDPLAERELDIAYDGDVLDLSRRNAEVPGHPAHLLEILSLDGDEVYYLDTSRTDPRGEHPVVLREGGFDDLTDFAPDFAAFLRRMLG